eukprot:scaffold405833_cov21-Prasinocladus_malaysianus.AAC.1
MHVRRVGFVAKQRHNNALSMSMIMPTSTSMYDDVNGNGNNLNAIQWQCMAMMSMQYVDAC